MALSNCQECGKLFNKIAVGICPACFEKIEEDFEKVHNYLKENGAANVDLINKETGVDKKRIMKFLAEGRFEGVSVTYKCEHCGVEISSGKICGLCLSKFSKEIQGIQQKNTAPKQQEKHKGFYSSSDRYNNK